MMCCSMNIVKMAWLLDDASFIKVAAVVLLCPPFSNNPIISSGVDDSDSINP